MPLCLMHRCATGFEVCSFFFKKIYFTSSLLLYEFLFSPLFFNNKNTKNLFFNRSFDTVAYKECLLQRIGSGYAYISQRERLNGIRSDVAVWKYQHPQGELIHLFFSLHFFLIQQSTV